MNDYNSYQDSRGRIATEVFYRVSPNFPSLGISLLLSGSVDTNYDPETEIFTIDTGSIRQELYRIVGVGIPTSSVASTCDYKDTLRTCEQVRLPFLLPDSSSTYVDFVVDSRTMYDDWVYLWNDTEGNEAFVSGSWFVENLVWDSNSYSELSGSTRTIYELDYTCKVPGPDKSVIFVVYKPDNFEFAGEYNAILNNAQVDALDSLFLISSSVKVKKHLSDYHKVQSIGGHHAGELHVDQGTDNKLIRTRDFIEQYESRGKKTDDGVILQTLDLSFMSYRAISASVYVDRAKGTITEMTSSDDTEDTGSVQVQDIEPLWQVWENMQGGNVDDPETIYFIERSRLINYSGSEDNTVEAYQEVTIPVTGSILFKMDGHTPVRVSEATVYAPFLNRVYRTDGYGVVTDLYIGTASVAV